MDAKNAKIAGRNLTIILPGTWANIPLADEKTAHRFVKDVVRRRVGSDDRLARLRAQTTDEVMHNVAEAVRIGVHTYLMSLELLPGVPFPAAILMLDQPWPDRARPGLGAKDVSRALREGFPGGKELDLACGPVLRITEMSQATVADAPLTVLRLEYHIPYPSLDKVLYARISVPNLPLAEQIIALFDEIIDSIRFIGDDHDPQDVPTAD